MKEKAWRLIAGLDSSIRPGFKGLRESFLEKIDGADNMYYSQVWAKFMDSDNPETIGFIPPYSSNDLTGF